MKILYITLEDLSLHKGSVTHIKEIVAGLQKRGHQVGLIGRPWKSIVLSSLFLLISLFGKLPQYDVIYARDYHTVILALLPRLFFRKKLVYEINGIANEEQKLKKDSFLNRILVFLIEKAERMATRCSDRIVSVTPQILSHLMTNSFYHPEKVEVIGNGVDIKKFRPIHNEALLGEWKERLGIRKEEIVIAFVGNLARWQGVNILIESAIRLLSRGERLKLLLVGDGPLKKELVRKVMGSVFSKEFIFTGMIRYEDIPILINLADICVAPFISRRNRITGVSPLKVFEYMACGKPVICSRIGGLEFIEAEGVGHLIEPEDVMSLQEALIDLIENPQKRIIMGNKGLQIAREKFDWESRVIEIEKVLIELA
jgi:glycosyltransferase involved in cell wall biosynthesis